MGIVFQFFQLLPTLTIAENIILPMDFCNVYSPRERRDRAIALLDKVGIAEQAEKLPSSLTGGNISVAEANHQFLHRLHRDPVKTMSLLGDSYTERYFELSIIP